MVSADADHSRLLCELRAEDEARYSNNIPGGSGQLSKFCTKDSKNRCA